jgi:hypothetical protein
VAAQHECAGYSLSRAVATGSQAAVRSRCFVYEVRYIFGMVNAKKRLERKWEEFIF